MLMLAKMAALCVATAATFGPALAGDPAAAPVADPAVAVDLALLTPPDISGRWTGTTHAIAADPSRCGPDGCTLTLDITKCGEAWCGVEVGADNACKGQALTLKSGQDENKTPSIFSGKLSLGAGAEDYVVEAVVRQFEGQPRQLSFIGDTGPELMIFRRSFPFRAMLSAAGEATCKPEKPVG